MHQLLYYSILKGAILHDENCFFTSNPKVTYNAGLFTCDKEWFWLYCYV